MQEQRATTLQEKMDFVAALSLFPAMTIMVFLRKKLGYRFLSPIRYQIMVLLIWALGAFSTLSGGPVSGGILFIFGLAVFIAASVERWLRWRDIKSGVSWHTYSRGIPWLAYVLPLRETVVKRFVDPLAAAIVGVLLFFPFRFLGLYILFSAVCLFIFESSDYQRSINRMLDQLDNLVESEVVSENVDYFQQGGSAAERPVEQTAGIPTGTDPDLAAAIERRRARGRGSQPAQASTPRAAQEPEQGTSRPIVRDRDIIGNPPEPPPAQPEPSGQLRRERLQVQSAPVAPPAQQAPSVSQPPRGQLRRERIRQAVPEPLDPAVMETQSNQQGIPVIQSPDDPAFAALPSGAEFMTPDGKKRIKK